MSVDDMNEPTARDIVQAVQRIAQEAEVGSKTAIRAMLAVDEAGLLLTPERYRQVAARALREAAEVFDGGLPRRGIDDSWREAGTNYIRTLRERADRIEEGDR